DEHGAMFSGGPDAFVEWLPSMMANWEATIHAITNSLFAIEGDDAEGEHLVMALHRSHPPERREFTVWGRYLDRYQRRDGEWKFLRRRLVFDHGSIIAVDEDGFAAMGAMHPMAVPTGLTRRGNCACLRNWGHDRISERRNIDGKRAQRDRAFRFWQ
ncbi:MAG: nuclear transport factor 2 family protein, partial [Sphingomonadales bacterium]|nr:nuclear transport factor 2 family protein [Sphingomonadales bacterium]